MDAIRVSHLKKYFRDIKAVDDISFEVKQGELFGFLGVNGAGKSTLLKQMIGFIKPDQGDVHYGDISFIHNRKQAGTMMSYMSQQYAPLEKLTVEQNLEMIGRMRGLSTSELQKEIEHLLADLEIVEYRDKKGKNLSGGLKRLTSFAMALIGSADIMLLDEPTNDVDPVRREKQWRLLQKLAYKGHTIIIVTHNLLEVEKYADNFALFNHGKLLKSGPVHQMSYKNHYQISFNFVSKEFLSLFEHFTMVNGCVCQMEIEESELTRILIQVKEGIEKGLISNLSVKMKTLSISDLYKEELVN